MNDQFYRLKEELVPVFKYTREKVYIPLPRISVPQNSHKPRSSSAFIFCLLRQHAYRSLYLRPICQLPPQHPPPAAPASLGNSPQRNSSSAAEVANPLTTAPQWKFLNPSCHQPTSTASPTNDDPNPPVVQLSPVSPLPLDCNLRRRTAHTDPRGRDILIRRAGEGRIIPVQLDTVQIQGVPFLPRVIIRLHPTTVIQGT